MPCPLAGPAGQSGHLPTAVVQKQLVSVFLRGCFGIRSGWSKKGAFGSTHCSAGLLTLCGISECLAGLCMQIVSVTTSRQPFGEFRVSQVPGKG